MSQGNVEVVRRSYEALARNDIEGALEAIDPQIEIHDHDLPDAGEYREIDGMFRWQADWEASWESWRWEPEEFLAAGDRVVVALRVHAKGAGAAWKSTASTARCGPCGTARAYDSITTAARPRPLQPWGCRSKRDDSQPRLAPVRRTGPAPPGRSPSP